MPPPSQWNRSGQISEVRAEAGGLPPTAHAGAQQRNGLLAALPDEERLHIEPMLERVSMAAGQVLQDAGESLTHAYFPSTAIVSVLFVTESGGSAEIAVVGREGVIGIPIFMGGGSTPARVVVQSPGTAFRIAAGALRTEFARSQPLRQVLLRYTQALIAQMAQIAVCNRHHTVDQQLCRWLLMRLDRGSGNDVTATQEFISHMLGVRRESVTDAASALQRADVIRYQRGRITVLDRPGLERGSCECYEVVRAEYERLLAADDEA